MKKHSTVRRIIAVFLCLFFLYCALPFSAPLIAYASTAEELERSWDLYHMVLSSDPNSFSRDFSYTKEERQYLEQVAEEATNACATDKERIFAIVEYVARNVYYDYDYLYDWTNTTYFDAFDVLKNGYAVCDGYARTVDELLTLLQIPCIYIVTLPSTDGLPHAFNMAFDGERWILVDATWASGNTKTNGSFHTGNYLDTRWVDFPVQQAIADDSHRFVRVELSYNDGALYQLSGSSLPDGVNITLPSTIQNIFWMAFANANTLYLPRSVKTIQDNAFAGITFSKVIYEGSREEFNAIEIGDGNETLLNAPITYLDCASVPSITRHPLDLVTSVGMEVTLTAATTPVDGTISYQWYRSTSRSNTTGIAIPDANQPIYTFTPEEEGTYYYYVVASNQNFNVSGNPVSSDTSVAAQVDVLDRVPDDIFRLGPNVIGYQFSNPTETHLTGTGPLWSVFHSYDIGTAIISSGITEIENCLDWLSWCDAFFVDPSHPDYCSDEQGILYQKSTNTLLCVPKYVYKNTNGSYNIPESIHAIADEAFASMYLKHLHIPAHVNDIQGSLGILSALRQITVDSNHPRFSVHDTALIDTIGNRLIKFPVYSNVSEYSVPNGIRKIEDQAFYYAKINHIVFPDTLQVIGNEAFKYCTTLCDTLTLPDGLVHIGDNAFSGCTNLSGTLVIPDNVTSLGDGCFESCSNISSVLLPSGLEVLPSMSFFSCSALTEISLPYGLRRMEDSCLSYSGLKEITIPATVSYIAESAFSDHESIIVHGCAGSYAETYAKAHNMPFVNVGIPATSIKAENIAAEMIVGMDWAPEFSLLPFNTTDAVTLTSSDPSIVSVINGYKLSAKQPGQVTIQAETTGGASCSFSVTVHNASGLKITVPPTQIDYECSEVLDLSGIQVEAILSSGKTLEVSDFTVSAFDSRNPGKKMIKVSIGDLSDTFSVYVGALQSGNWTDTCQWICSPSGALTVTGTLPANTKLLAATYHSSGKLAEVSFLSLDQKWQPTKAADYAQLYLLQEELVPAADSIRIPLPLK